MKKFLSILFSGILCFAMSSLAGAEEISLSGSSTIRPIIKKAGKLFKKQTGIAVKTKGGGSSVGAKDAIAGTTNLGMCSRDLKDKETAAGLIPHTIGLDGIAIIVNSSNPIKKITSAQIVAIYTGKTTNWSELGGADHAIVVETKAEGRSTKELFEKFFKLKNKVISSAHIIGSNAEALAFISGEPNAIGYVSVGTAEGAANKGVGITLLDLNGVPASVKNVASKTYPLRRPLNLASKGEASGLAKQFIDFMLSPEGQEIVEEKEFVPVH